MSKKEEVNQKWYPKVSNCSVFRRTLVGKRKSSTRASSIHTWQVLSATLGHCYSQYYLSITELNFWQFKLVKEQSLILCNSKFTAKKERRWNIHPPFVVSVAALIMNSGAPWVRKIGYYASTHSCKQWWNFAFQVPARIGGKSHSYSDF